MDMIVGYAKERKTFGRPIGAYQAVRHPCADMAAAAEKHYAGTDILAMAAAVSDYRPRTMAPEKRNNFV